MFGFDAKRNHTFFETASYDFHGKRARFDVFVGEKGEIHGFTVFDEISRHGISFFHFPFD